MSRDKTGPGRPVDLSKREAVLAATRSLMQTRGMAFRIDDVATQAGVARQTVYNAFGGKDQLLAAVIGDSVAKLMQPLDDPLLAQDSREALRALGQRYAQMSFQPHSIALVRALIAQGDKAQRFADLFFRTGPELAYARLRQFLLARVQAGELRIADADVAVDQFYGLMRGTAHFRLLMGSRNPPTEAELRRRVDAAVDMFMRAYAAR